MAILSSLKYDDNSLGRILKQVVDAVNAGNIGGPTGQTGPTGPAGGVTGFRVAVQAGSHGC